MTVYQILHYLDEPYKEVFTLKVLGELNYKRELHRYLENRRHGRELPITGLG